MSRLACSLVLTSVVFSAASARDFAKPPPGPAGTAHGAGVTSSSSATSTGATTATTTTAVTTGTEVTDRSALRIAPPVVDRAQLRAKLLANRRANLARFHAYRIGGVYPSNVFTSSLGNIWRDQQGHYCAAATIIRASGAIELVERIAENNNFFRIADVEQGPVMDWILTSGLTQEELVVIQKPFQPVTWQPEIAPTTTVEIDPKLRAAETRRLAKLYRAIERKLVTQQRASLETAVDRLIKHPHLARQLLAS